MLFFQDKTLKNRSPTSLPEGESLFCLQPTSLFEGGAERSEAEGARLPDSFSHGCAVPDLRRSACLPPAQRAASSTSSKRELFGEVLRCCFFKTKL